MVHGNETSDSCTGVFRIRTQVATETFHPGEKGEEDPPRGLR